MYIIFNNIVTYFLKGISAEPMNAAHLVEKKLQRHMKDMRLVVPDSNQQVLSMPFDGLFQLDPPPLDIHE